MLRSSTAIALLIGLTCAFGAESKEEIERQIFEAQMRWVAERISANMRVCHDEHVTGWKDAWPSSTGFETTTQWIGRRSAAFRDGFIENDPSGQPFYVGCAGRLRCWVLSLGPDGRADRIEPLLSLAFGDDPEVTQKRVDAIVRQSDGAGDDLVVVSP